jgi:hypothetical protein
MIHDTKPQTLFDFLRPCVRDTPTFLMQKAVVCSAVAKMARGHTRRSLYRIKDQNLVAVQRDYPEQISIKTDHDRYVGLLSFSCRARPGLRVHSHPGWLGAA